MQTFHDLLLSYNYSIINCSKEIRTTNCKCSRTSLVNVKKGEKLNVYWFRTSTYKYS
ncbi:unnamed protein product, partial [Nesidiocoris tenuis]